MGIGGPVVEGPLHYGAPNLKFSTVSWTVMQTLHALQSVLTTGIYTTAAVRLSLKVTLGLCHGVWPMDLPVYVSYVTLHHDLPVFYNFSMMTSYLDCLRHSLQATLQQCNTVILALDVEDRRRSGVATVSHYRISS